MCHIDLFGLKQKVYSNEKLGSEGDRKKWPRRRRLPSEPSFSLLYTRRNANKTLYIAIKNPIFK